MHRINLRGPWHAAREAADYSVLRKFHAPPKLDATCERVRLTLLLASPLRPRVRLNGIEMPVLIDGPPAAIGGVLGRCDISTILAAYNSLALCWDIVDTAQMPLPQGELKISPASPHPLLLDAWLEIDER